MTDAKLIIGTEKNIAALIKTAVLTDGYTAPTGQPFVLPGGKLAILLTKV